MVVVCVIVQQWCIGCAASRIYQSSLTTSLCELPRRGTTTIEHGRVKGWGRGRERDKRREGGREEGTEERKSGGEQNYKKKREMVRWESDGEQETE